MHAIDYGHKREGVLYHGTLSDADGVPRCTWTYEEGGQKVTREQRLDAARFGSLWQTAVSAEVFRRNRVTDPNRPIDPVQDHVISLLARKGEEQRREVFLVPAGENDPEFLRWLQTLNVPTGSLSAADGAGAGERASRLAAAREAVYPRFFGPKWTVRPAPAGESPAIAVYDFQPGEDATGKRDFHTLVTSGMSDAPMRTPEGMPFRRAELLLYVDQPTETHVRVLRWLATLPQVQETTWYGAGTTMTNGQPPQPIFEGSQLECFLFMTPIVNEDHKVHEQLVLEGDPTTVLFVVPITSPECDFILSEGYGAFTEVLDKKRHPFLLNERRRSYVGAAGGADKPWWKFW